MNHDLLDAAACLWEHAQSLHEDWERADYDAPFDWEFVPAWFELNVQAGETGPVLAETRRLPP